MIGVKKRLGVVSVLALLIVGGAIGLAVVLGQSHSHSQAQLRHAAEDRASLAAALIDSVFSGSYDATSPTARPLSQAEVTGAEIIAARRRSPLTAVFGASGALLASHPALAPAVRRLIAGQPAVAAALTDGRRHLSSLLPGTAGTPPGFLDVAPFHTRYGMRATVTWLPLRTLASVLDRYLGYVASFTVHQRKAKVLMLDGNDAVIGSATGSAEGRPLADRQLRAVLDRRPSGSRFAPGGARFFASTGLTVAPWTVVYTTQTDALYASQGRTWKLSLLLLAGFLAAAAACLALLVGLLASLDRLAKANAALGERNREVERATEAKSRFVASMAHELRTPLSAVIGFSELIQIGRAGRVTPTQSEYLGIVRSSADHLLELINEALDLAKVEAGELRLRPEAIEPDLVARQCVRALQALADDREVRIEIGSEAAGVMSLDPARLRQVILNFLSNAIKFSHPRGRVELRLAREGERLTITVSDEGIGISDADRERVFEEFVQLGDRVQAGSGLGLAVTRRIVEAQGGEVAVASEPGVGSTFTAWLPWVAPESGVAGPPTDERWRQMVAELARHAGTPPVSPADDTSPSSGPRFDRGREPRRRRRARAGR